MRLFKNIKTFFGKRRLQSQAINTHKGNSLMAFNDIKDIGIVYNAADKKTEDNIKQFANSLRELGKKVFLLGYIDEKVLPSSKKMNIQSEFFWQEKLDALNLPDKHKIGRFLTTHFDVLMGIYFDDLLPLHAISVYSWADYKISALHQGGTKYFDAMIDTKSNKDVANLSQQIFHYLNVIK